MRWALPVMAALTLGSCSYEFPVRAVFDDGDVTFVSDDDAVTSEPWCMYDFRVADGSGQTVWHVELYRRWPDPRRCGPNFPLRYGGAPAFAKTIVAARPLRSGELYTIHGRGSGSYTGAFRYRERRIAELANIDRDDPDARAANERAWRHGADARPVADRASTAPATD